MASYSEPLLLNFYNLDVRSSVAIYKLESVSDLGELTTMQCSFLKPEHHM